MIPTQTRQRARDMLKVNERLVEQISELKSMNYQLQQDLYDKAAELNFQESHNNEQLKEVVLANDAWIKSIQEINSDDMRRLLVKSIKQIAEEEGITKERIKLFEAGKVVTIFYKKTLTLHDRNLFTLLLFFRLLAKSTQSLVWDCHHKARKASAGLDEEGSGADPFLSAHHHRHHQSPACC